MYGHRPEWPAAEKISAGKGAWSLKVTFTSPLELQAGVDNSL